MAHFVFEELSERFDELELEPAWKATDVVMTLDHLGSTSQRHALDHVRIQRPLGQKAGAANFPGLFFEDRNELPADDLPFLFGIGHVLEPTEETIRSIGVDHFEV